MEEADEIKKARKKRSPFRDAVVFALAYQIPLLILGMLATDFGVLGQLLTITFLAFWGGVGVLYLLKRKKKNFSKHDLFLIRAGFLPLCVVTHHLCNQVWQWRGLM